jgi:hypothetical protein
MVIDLNEEERELVVESLGMMCAKLAKTGRDGMPALIKEDRAECRQAMLAHDLATRIRRLP